MPRQIEAGPKSPSKIVTGSLLAGLTYVLVNAITQNLALVPITALWLAITASQYGRAWRRRPSLVVKHGASLIVLGVLSVVYMIVVIAAQT